MSKYAKLFIPVLLICAFTYGLAVGHFRVFPFHQVIELRNKVFDLAGAEYGRDDDSIQLAEAVEILETALHRILLKKIHLKQGQDIGRGGTMTNIDYKIFINVNSNDSDRDLILVYDLENHFQYKTDTLKVPMNYEELLSSSLVELEGFDLFRYRVSGLYAEKNQDDTYTLYASHNFYEKDQNCISFNISKTSFSINENTLKQNTGWETIFTADPCIFPEKNIGFVNPFPGHMAGGKIVEYDDNTLLVSVGSFSTDPSLFTSLPMDTLSSIGKILLINKTTGESRIFAKGFRNPQGLFIDSSGTIWSTDHGPYGGDELNIIKENGNYGWPIVTYGINYRREEWPHSLNQGRHENYDKPVFVWMPAIAPANISQIQGDKFSLWNRDLIIGGLTGRGLHRLRIENGNRVIYNEMIRLGHRIRDLAILPDEKIVLLTDEGSLFILDDGGPLYDEIGTEMQARIAALDLFDQLIDDIDKTELPREQLNAESIYTRHCSSCHFLAEIHDVGPHLNNLFAREVGGLADFNYSYNLKESSEKWSPDLLKSFLLEPDNRFPNTSMAQIPLTSAEVDSIISVLGR